MQSIDYNLTFLQIMLDEFEAFPPIHSGLLATHYNKQIQKDKTSPRLTLGGLYLTLDELAAQITAMNRDQEKQYYRLMRTLDRFTSKWEVSIEKKAQQELNSRLNLWQGYLNDLEDDPEQIEHYLREVRIRVMISRLIDRSGSSNEVDEKINFLKSIDFGIGAFVEPGSFMWDKPLKEVYPQDEFPFLYRSPRS